MRAELEIEAPNGARVAPCAHCRRPFYSREAGTHCQVCSERTCLQCGYKWQGAGAGAARDACPMLGCTGRV
jgi:hypothetical protein